MLRAMTCQHVPIPLPTLHQTREIVALKDEGNSNFTFDNLHIMDKSGAVYNSLFAKSQSRPSQAPVPGV